MSLSEDFSRADVKAFLSNGAIKQNVSSAALLSVVKGKVRFTEEPPYPQVTKIDAIIRKLPKSPDLRSAAKCYQRVLQFWANCIFLQYSQKSELRQIRKELGRVYANFPAARELAEELARPRRPMPPKAYKACLKLLMGVWLFRSNPAGSPILEFMYVRG